MTWLTWRQHRAQFYAGAALLAALAVLLLITGLQAASQWHSALVACTATHSCSNQGGLFLGNREIGFLVIMTLGAPVLVGLFWCSATAPITGVASQASQAANTRAQPGHRAVTCTLCGAAGRRVRGASRTEQCGKPPGLPQRKRACAGYRRARLRS